MLLSPPELSASHACLSDLPSLDQTVGAEENASHFHRVKNPQKGAQLVFIEALHKHLQIDLSMMLKEHHEQRANISFAHRLPIS